jgi:hypothetical protein
MCIACEIAFMDVLDAVSPEERERILREQAQSQRFSCEAPANEPPQQQPINADERKP